jgi:hypothetical protein
VTQVTPSAGRVLWDLLHVLLVDVLEHGCTINADGYCATLEILQMTFMRKHPSPSEQTSLAVNA